MSKEVTELEIAKVDPRAKEVAVVSGGTGKSVLSEWTSNAARHEAGHFDLISQWYPRLKDFTMATSFLDRTPPSTRRPTPS